MFNDKGQTHEFTSLVRELAGPGVASGMQVGEVARRRPRCCVNSMRLPMQSYKFSFPRVEMPYESYDGINVRVRYLVRVTVSRSTYATNMSKELEFLVQNVEPVGYSNATSAQSSAESRRCHRRHPQRTHR